MGRLLGGGGVAGFSAPNTVQGVGTAGGNTQGGLGYLSQMIQDIRDPTPNQTSMNDVLNGIPTPNKLNSNEFLRAAPSHAEHGPPGDAGKVRHRPERCVGADQEHAPAVPGADHPRAVKR